MSIDEYYLAFESILYGLIISRILVKWAEMFKEGQKDSFDWVYILITINVFFLIIYLYWINRQPSHYANVAGPFMFFVNVVLPPAIFTFMTYQVFPGDFSQVKQENYLIKHRKLIFIPWAIYLIYNVAVLSDKLIHPTTISAFITLVIIGFIIKSTKIVWIKVFAIVHTLLMIYGYSRFYMN